METPKTVCLACGNEWIPVVWEKHLSVCGVCVKQTVQKMESQFTPKPRLRLEGQK